MSTAPMTQRDGNTKFLCMMAAFLLLAFLFQVQQAQQDATFDRQMVNQRIIADSQAAITRNQVNLCMARNTASASHNDLIDELVSSVRSTPTLTAKERTDRIDRYNAAKIELLTCPARTP